MCQNWKISGSWFWSQFDVIFSVILIEHCTVRSITYFAMCGLQNTFSVSIIFLQNRNKGFKSIFTVNGKQKAMILYKEVFEAKAAHLCGRSTLPATAVYRQRRLAANKSLMYSPLNALCTDMKSGEATMAGFKFCTNIMQFWFFTTSFD